MKISKQSLYQYIIFFILLVALTIATISALDTTKQIQYSCQISNCDLVRHSQYSKIGNIDIVFLGIAYTIGVILTLTIRALKNKKSNFINNNVLYLLGFGILFGTYLRYIEIFKLHAWCELCVSFYILLILATVLSIRYKKKFYSKA